MNKMIIANLIHRPVRSLISMIAIAVEVTLILVVVGLLLGILNDSRQRQAGMGADVIVQPPGSSFLSAASGAPVSIKVADILAKMDHVRVVAPVVTQLNVGASVEVIYGIDLKTWEELGGPFRYLEGGPFQKPYDIIVDDIVAESDKMHVGSTVRTLNQDFQVCGIVEHGRGARKYLPMATMQELVGSQGKVSVFYVKLDDPKNADAVASAVRMRPGMEKYVVRSLREYLSIMTPGNLPGFSATVKTVITVAVVIGFIVIFQAMYTAVLERTREIGILKSLGASKFYIVRLILRETILLAVCGIILGIGLSYATRFAVLKRFPTMRVQMTGEWMMYAALIAMAGALLGAIYPAFKAAHKDPIDALAYE